MKQFVLLAALMGFTTAGFSQNKQSPTAVTGVPVKSSAEATKEEVRAVISDAVVGMGDVLRDATQILQVLNEPATQEQIKEGAKQLVRKVNPAEVRRLSDFLEDLAREIDQEIRNMDRRPEPKR